MVTPHDYYFGHSWMLGHGDFASIDQIRAAMADLLASLVADGLDPNDEPPLGVVFLPHPEIVLVYWGLSEGAGDYSEHRVTSRRCPRYTGRHGREITDPVGWHVAP